MASSSSSSPSAPTFSSQSWNHDVFLSFRGKDTRKNFVDHLYAALVLQGIDTYKDDETLRQGETIRPALMRAIEESQIAIIIFSKNYADSSWCLDEVAHIMECKKTRGQIVMPVFYGVEPSEVRKQTNIYGEAFVKHELEKKNKVESWKKALEDAGNLSGWEPKNIANGHETKVIKEIVDKILLRVELVTSSANEKLVGMPARVQLLESELQLEAGGRRMVGIWGVGGGGKTTLASCIYNKISRKFDGCCFIENIREHGLKELKTEILLKMGANSARSGGCLIDQSFRKRKVLIVLDDVDQRGQLEALAGSPDWFGEGSRIIITTRDEHLLKAHKVVVHDISLLQGNEASKLFRKHAFRGSIPMKDYEKLSEEVVSYAGGLPLALTVLGSSLCDKNIAQWRSALARLKEIPDDEILQKLKVSFDGLTKVQKDLFLDIACFFRRVDKDETMKRLDACGFHPLIGVEELRQKALITISGGVFDMHDLVQEMGHYIVRGEHPKNPEKHSRVWKKEDILTICAMDATMELDKIEAIQLNYISFPGHEEPPPIVANMTNLRYIQWKGGLATEKFSPWELFLRYIQWKRDPANPLVKQFPPRKLCCLILRGAIQDHLWNGYKVLPNLKVMELYDLGNLMIVTPSFDGIRCLEIFKLFRCPELIEIHSSFGGLDRLVCLSIEECSNIRKFPSITLLTKLETLSFSMSPGLFKLSGIQRNRKQLCVFCRDLRKLNLRGCKLGDRDMASAVWNLPNLQELNLSHNEFSQLNFSRMQIPRLKLLDVSLCTDLVELSGLPSSIAVLNAINCILLITIGDISNCKWLWKVSLYGNGRVDSSDGCKLVDYMLKGNTSEDHHISVSLQNDIPKGFSLFRGSTFTQHLPHDWYNDFRGILIHVVTFSTNLNINIIIKQQEVESQVQRWKEYSNEALEPEYGTQTYVGYVSFESLRRHTTCLNSYNLISITLCQAEYLSSEDDDKLGVQLVPHNNPVQTTKLATDCSEFWDAEDDVINSTFTIACDSKSSISILWKPL